MTAVTQGEREAETVEIVDLSDDCRGIAHTPGKTVFVHGALPGETVVVSRGRRRRRHDEARLMDVIQPAAERARPGCAHYELCGGCGIQHQVPAAQRATKQARLLRLLREAGARPEKVYEPISGPVWGYRRRARLGVRYVTGKGRVLVGFRERHKPYIADLESCPVLAAPASALLRPLADTIGALSIRRRLPQVEVSIADDRSAFVLRTLDPPSAADLEVLRSFEREHDVDLYLQPGALDTVHPLSPPGRPLSYRLPGFGLELLFGPTDFVQVNAQVNARMVERAVELLAPVAGLRVLDLFCGIGNFTLAFASSGAKVTGVEGDAALVARARVNADRNGLTEVDFHASDLMEDCRGRPWAGQSYDAVMLDPARAGAGPVLPLVAHSGARNIVYVSCNPVTLARDAASLVTDHGFRLAGAGIVDMFPHTAHVESIALFERGA